MFTSFNRYSAFNFMNFVNPIRDRKKIAQIKNTLQGQGRFRDLLLFVVGINTALRIDDFLDNQGRIKRRFWIKEKKHGKRHEIVINNSIREILAEYLASYHNIANNPDNFLFFNSKTNNYRQPIHRGQA